MSKHAARPTSIVENPNEQWALIGFATQQAARSDLGRNNSKENIRYIIHGIHGILGIPGIHGILLSFFECA